MTEVIDHMHTKGSPLPESKPQDIKTNSGLYSYATGIIT